VTETTIPVSTLPPGPGPDGSSEFWRDPLNIQWDWWNQFGDLWTLELPSGPMVFLGSPDLAEQLFTRHHDHGEMVRRTVPAQGAGITTQDGAEWRRSRLLMQPMFGRPALRQLADLVAEAVDSKLNEFGEDMSESTEIDLSKLLGQITIRVLFHSMFSDEFSADEIDFAVRQLDLISIYKGQLMAGAWAPGGLVPGEAAGKQAVIELDTLLYRAIARRRANPTGGRDLLDRLIEARDGEGDQFSDEEIRDQLTVLFFGGYETTQWGTAWALAMLAENPEAMARCRVEADLFRDRLPHWDDWDQLEYIRATFDEALRWQSMVMVPRQIQQDDVFGGYALSAGTLVVASPWVIHRREDLWDQPATFDPDRFLGDRRKAQHKYQHIPFGGGARTCLGMNLSYLEAQFILALFLQRYDYELPAGFVPVHKHQYSVVIDGGLPATVKRRS
jgi:cytochrome P450